MNVTEVVSAVASHMTRSVLGKLSQAGSVHHLVQLEAVVNELLNSESA